MLATVPLRTRLVAVLVASIVTPAFSPRNVSTPEDTDTVTVKALLPASTSDTVRPLPLNVTKVCSSAASLAVLARVGASLTAITVSVREIGLDTASPESVTTTEMLRTPGVGFWSKTSCPASF